MGRKSLPYDARIEYIQSSGTQYINTLYYPNNNTRVVCDMQIVDDSQYGRLFGCSSGSEWNSAPSIQINYEDYVSGSLGATCGNQTTWSRSSSVTGDYDRHNYELSNTSLCRDNVQVVSLSGDTFQCTGSLAIFSHNKGGTISSDGQEFSRAKLYSFKIYENGNLARDFIPVRVGSVGYLYDNVSKTLFGNSGTGQFALGQDMEYKEIEYLESTGTQYINTNKINTRSTDLNLEFLLTDSINEDRKIIGQGAKFGLAIQSGYWRVIGENWVKTSYTVDTNRHAFRTNSNKYYVDITEIYQQNKNPGSYPMLIFHVSSVNSIAPDGNGVKMKLYSCKIYESNVLICDFIPVRVGQVGYLYDKVSDTFFGNSGSGSFILGPDK